MSSWASTASIKTGPGRSNCLGAIMASPEIITFDELYERARFIVLQYES